ncbi:hypothetical protein [Rhodoligotrophos defluvii]|uniref:hypothetical protein n=1 Tax=Rhodoligotrophos defluvii TaxID=2561934 RepID=UPI0010C9D4D8|nr:hypothetical protein [Rhodoligotrophos defluvii]
MSPPEGPLPVASEVAALESIESRLIAEPFGEPTFSPAALSSPFGAPQRVAETTILESELAPGIKPSGGSLVQARKAFFEGLGGNPDRIGPPIDHNLRQPPSYETSNPAASQTVENNFKIIDRPLEDPELQKPATATGMVARLKQKFEALAGHPAAESLDSSSGYGSTASLRSEPGAGRSVENLASTNDHRAHEVPAPHQEANNPVESLSQLSDHDFNQTFGPEQKMSNPVETLGRMSENDFKEAFGTKYQVNTLDQVRADLKAWAAEDRALDRQVGAIDQIRDHDLGQLPKFAIFSENGDARHELYTNLEDAAINASKQLSEALAKIDRGSEGWRSAVIHHLDTADEARMNALRHVADVLFRADLGKADLAGNGSEAEATLRELANRFNDVVRTHTTIFDNSAHLVLSDDLRPGLAEPLAREFHLDAEQLTRELGDILAKAHAHFDV